MKQNQALERRERSSSVVTIWSTVGGAMIVSIPDIKRYIKVRTM